LLINQPVRGWSIDQQDMNIFCIYLQDSILLHSKLADQGGSAQLFSVISGIIFTQASSRESKVPRDQPRYLGKPKYLLTFSVISGIIFTQATSRESKVPRDQPRYLGKPKEPLHFLGNLRYHFHPGNGSRDSSSQVIDGSKQWSQAAVVSSCW
jgi:hypothetical protein